MAAELSVEGVARLVQEAGRTIRVIGDRRGDEERLIGGALGHPHVLLHPAALGLLILVLVAPAGVGTFEQVHQAFAFLRLVAVVVDTDHVAEVVEGDLLGVPDAMGEDFEVGTVGFAAQHGAAMREREPATFLAGDVAALVADGPIDPAVGSQAQPMHVMACVSDMTAEAGRHQLLHVSHAVAVGILEAPDIRDGRDVDPAVEIEDARGDA